MSRRLKNVYIGQTIYHIQFDNRRTTISVDNLLSSLMALKLGHLPDDPKARTKVRLWLESKLRESLGKNARKDLSKMARIYLTLEIADKRLSSRFWDYFS